MRIWYGAVHGFILYLLLPQETALEYALIGMLLITVKSYAFERLVLCHILASFNSRNARVTFLNILGTFTTGLIMLAGLFIFVHKGVHMPPGISLEMYVLIFWALYVLAASTSTGCDLARRTIPDRHGFMTA